MKASGGKRAEDKREKEHWRESEKKREKNKSKEGTNGATPKMSIKAKRSENTVREEQKGEEGTETSRHAGKYNWGHNKKMAK